MNPTAPLWFALSYLVGAIPTSYLAGRVFKGIDLREHGSKNLGATNVYRVLGWRFAVPVAVVDILKGTVPVVFFAPRVSPSPLVGLLVGVCAIVGHVFSVFVGFRGGKGVATAAGVMLGLAPAAAGLCLLLWVVLVRATGYVSVGSMAAAAVLPLGIHVLHPDRRELVLPSAALGAAIIWFHRANISRLRQGTENRFGRRRAAGEGR